MFSANIGKADRVIRFMVGVVVVSLGVAYANWFGLIGVVLMGTAFIRWCPAYVPFRISTCAVQAQCE